MGHRGFNLDTIPVDNGRLVPLISVAPNFTSNVSTQRKNSLYNSKAGKFLKEKLPDYVWKAFSKIVLGEVGLDSEEAVIFLKYALGVDEKGNPNSKIAQWVCENPVDPRAFKILYGLEDAKSPLDVSYIMTKGAHAIYLRLMSLIEKLPEIILAERKKLKLSDSEKYILWNIGSGHCLDVIWMLEENPKLVNLVEIVNIDPDEEALGVAKNLVSRNGNGIEKAFEFKVQKADKSLFGIDRKPHMMLLIGLFCPTKTENIIKTLSFLSYLLQKNGLFIFSTVQEKMLREDTVLNVIMQLYGWLMDHKTLNDIKDIIQQTGLHYEESMSWHDEFEFNRMTVARKIT